MLCLLKYKNIYLIYHKQGLLEFVMEHVEDKNVEPLLEVYIEII